MKLTPLAVDHVALPIFHVEESLRFYGELLGLPLLSALSGDDWEGRPWLMMIFGCADGRQLALTALRGAPRPPRGELPEETQHLAFTVGSDDELAAWKRKLQAEELTLSEEEHGDQRSLYFRDPNGIVLELTTPRRATAAPEAQAAARALVARWLG